jgi:tetratricopeptide (TPR) repeat protein
MTKAIVRSVLMATVLAVGSLAVHAGQAPSGPAPKTSPALGETFTQAMKAQEAKRYAEAIAKYREILASPQKKADDVFAAHSQLAQIAAAQKDMAGTIAAMEGMLGSGFNAGPTVQNQLRKGLQGAHYQQKNDAEAIKYGTELVQAGAADEGTYTTLGQSYYRTRKYNDAVKLFGDIVSRDEKAGRKPERNMLILLQSSYDKAGNKEAAQATLEKVVRHYPDSKTWMALIYDLKKEVRDPRTRVQLYRLLDSTGNLDQAADFTAYSDSAMALGLMAEASRVLDKGIKAKAFATQTEADRAQRYLNSANERAAAGKAELAKLTTEAKAAPTGNEYVALGMQQANYEMYPEAIESLKAGIAKGGLKNETDAQMSLGYAHFKANQKGEAVKTFRAVNGGSDDLTQRLAKFWAMHSGG